MHAHLQAVYDSNETKQPAAAETGEDGHTQVALRFGALVVVQCNTMGTGHL